MKSAFKKDELPDLNGPVPYVLVPRTLYQAFLPLVNFNADIMGVIAAALGTWEFSSPSVFAPVPPPTPLPLAPLGRGLWFEKDREAFIYKEAIRDHPEMYPKVVLANELEEALERSNRVVAPPTHDYMVGYGYNRHYPSYPWFQPGLMDHYAKHVIPVVCHFNEHSVLYSMAKRFPHQFQRDLGLPSYRRIVPTILACARRLAKRMVREDEEQGRGN